MTTEEFVKNFYIEKQNILDLNFKTKIEELNLDEIKAEKLRQIVSNLLTDTFYTILLGLDGSANIGNSQEVFKIYDEGNNLISEGGDLEEHAYEYFHENKLETENSKCDFIAQIYFNKENEGGRAHHVKNDYRSQLVFNFDDYQTSHRQMYIDTNCAFPGDVVNAEVDILSQEYFYGKLNPEMGFKFYEGSQLIGTGRIIKIINSKLKKII